MRQIWHTGPAPWARSSMWTAPGTGSRAMCWDQSCVPGPSLDWPCAIKCNKSNPTCWVQPWTSFAHQVEGQELTLWARSGTTHRVQICMSDPILSAQSRAANWVYMPAWSDVQDHVIWPVGFLTGSKIKQQEILIAMGLPELWQFLLPQLPHYQISRSVVRTMGQLTGLCVPDPAHFEYHCLILLINRGNGREVWVLK